MDAGEPERLVVEKLESDGISFIDVGMGLDLVNGSLGGIVRATTSTSSKRDHLRNHVSFAGDGEPNVYSSNIQVADASERLDTCSAREW